MEAKDKRLGLVPMELGPGQIKLARAIRMQRERGLPVRIIFLKSRRVHASTRTAAHFFQNTITSPGVRALVFDHIQDSTRTLFGVYRRFHEQYKPFGGVVQLPQLMDGRGLRLAQPLSVDGTGGGSQPVVAQFELLTN